MRKDKNRSLSLAATSLLIATGSAWGATPGETHTVGGMISGLTGKGLVLRLLNSQSTGSISVSPPPGAVRFEFPTGLATGSAYAVTVQAQPVGPSQLCAVTRGQGGRIGNADVTDVVVDCSVAPDGQRPGTPRPAPNPQAEQGWDLYLEAFQVDVDIENLSYSDGYCSMSGGPVRAKFRESPSTRGKPPICGPCARASARASPPPACRTRTTSPCRSARSKASVESWSRASPFAIPAGRSPSSATSATATCTST